MTEQTETERNEAICVLEKALKEHESTYAESARVKERIEREPEMFIWKWEDGGYWVMVYENSPKYIKELQAAISALKQQSEVERRIEKIMEWCLSDKETESTRENIATERAQCEILEILEDKSE